MDNTILTKNEAWSVAEFIDQNLLLSIRNDPDIDSMQWLRNIVHAYEKLKERSGYVGLTDEMPQEIGSEPNSAQMGRLQG